MLLEDQDRRLWDRQYIAAGLRHLERAAAGQLLSAYHVQAAIAACHAMAVRPDDTDWRQIVAHYDTLLALVPSPVVQLNRAVAISMVHGPERGLHALDQIDAEALRGYYLLPATRAELLRRADRRAEAAAQYEATLELAKTGPERRFIEERIRRLREARDPRAAHERGVG